MKSYTHLRGLFAVAMVAFVGSFSGCKITQNVAPVPAGTQIGKIYIQENDRVHMEGLLDEMITQIEQLGFATETYTSDDGRPSEARYYMTYTANWRWDGAMYLSYFQAVLWSEGKVIGEVEYNAKSGGYNVNKFGTTADKIRPLLEELLAPAKRGSAEQ